MALLPSCLLYNALQAFSMIRRVAFLSTFYPFRGGIAQSNANLYLSFSHLGYETQAYTFTRQYPDLLFPGKSQYVTEQDETAAAVEARQLLDSLNPLTYLKTAKAIRAFQPDLLILRFWMPFFAPSLGTVAGRLRKQGTTVISIIDNAFPHEQRPGDNLLTHYFLNRLDGAVVMSQAVQDDLQRIKPSLPTQYHPHPVYDHFGALLPRSTAQERLKLDPAKKTLLFFGLVRSYKGLDLLLEAFKELPDDYQLVVAGEVYGDEAPYREQLANHPAAERAHLYLRYVDDQEVPLFYSAADLNVLPYRSATQSGIMAVALHFEVPVVATDTGGLREVVEDADIGLIAPSAASTALAQTIQRYFMEKDQNTMLAHIRQYKRKHSWEAMGRAIAEFAETLR